MPPSALPVVVKIKQEALSLQHEDSRTIVCPFCEADWEQQGYPAHWHPTSSCKLTRVVAGILYICYRAGCGKSGIIGDTASPVVRDKKEFVPTYCEHPHGKLPGRIIVPLGYELGMRREHFVIQGVGYCPTINALYFPIYNAQGYEIGSQIKHLDKTRWPKAFTYRHIEVPMLHFPLGQEKSDTLVLVEDPLSAIKVARITYCAALLGSNLSHEGAIQLKKQGIKKVIFALDPDALNKSLKQAKEYDGLFDASVWVLPADPKNCSYDLLRSYL